MTQTEWGETKAPTSTGDIVKVDWKSMTEVRARLVGRVLPRYVYWVTTKDGKPRSIECLSFDRTTQSFNSNLPDPITEVAPEILGDKVKPQFGYIAQFIDRKTGGICLFDPLKKGAFDEITALAKNPDYGNPADPLKGYDITVSKHKIGALAQQVRYKATPARASSPLTDAEQALTLYDLDKLFKRPTYDEQKKWLMENTTYFMLMSGSEGKLEGAKDL